ncbi:hypothetical protein [Thalassoglobus polymorphus]|uniref:Immunoglobulin G-binding protein A n=1 Tax=Thalassoglobus polymorphus TaxID=2527994 RepID=A0A517QPB6_9PLAN|nr:hypothetical protein [Thalassoglobus polymorphus]QDT33463.1 hypothetical protein Mal48_27160 [Thalassoglobus polymorphus]
MAVADPKSKPQKSASSKYVDFDEFIEYQLKKTRSGIHHTDVLSAVVVLAVFLTGYLLVFTIADHWIIQGGLSDLARTILLGIVGAISVTWLVTKIALPLYREVNILYAAKEIEESYPELKSSLVSWVQFREEGREIPSEILKAIEKRTALEIKEADVDQAVDRQFLMRSSYVLLGIVVVMCLYTVFSPKKLSNSVWRAFFPAASVSASTKTEILEVIPGDYEVLARDQLDVTVDLSGVIPENVSLLFTTSDHRFVDEPIPMRNTGEGLPRFRARLTGTNGEGLLKDLTYRIEAGDAVSDTYQIRIKQPPSATVTSIEYDYPDYMLLDDKSQSTSTIDAWEGVYVTVRAQTNMPITSAQLFRSDNDVAEETADVLTMQKTGPDQIEARWRLKFREDGTFANYYFIQVKNEAEESDPQPTIHRIKIRPDLKPEISILYPTEDLNVPANAVIPIAFEARDPDFMLRRVLLKIEREGELLPNVPRLFEGPETPEVRSKYRFDLKPLKLTTGDQLQFFLEAEDNFEPFDNLPKHVTRTSKLTINIVEPVEEEQAEQFTQEQEENLRQQLNESDPQQQERQQQQPPKEGSEMSEESAEEKSENKDPNEQGEPQDGGKQEEGDQQNAQPDQKNMSDSEQRERSGKKGDSSQKGESGQETEGDQPNPENTPNDKQGSNDPASMKENGDKEKSSEENPAEGTQTGEQNSEPDGTPTENTSQKNETGSSQKKTKKAEDDQALKKLLEWSEKNKEKNSDAEQQPDPAEQKETPNSDAAPNQENKSEPQETGESKPDPKSDSPMNSESESPGNPSADSPMPPGAENKDPASESTPEPKMDDDSKSDSPNDTPSANSPEKSGENPKSDPSAPKGESPQENTPENATKNSPQPSNSEGEKREDGNSSKTGEEPPADSPSEMKSTTPDKNQQQKSPETSNSETNKAPAGDMPEQTMDEPQPGEQKSGEQKSGEQMSGEQMSGEQKSGEQKSGEQKSGEQKSGEQKSGEQKSGEQKSGEQKSGEQKSGEQKSGEQKSGEQKSGEQKSGEQMSGEQKSGEQKSGEQMSGEQMSGEQMSGEQKSGEQKPGEQKPGEQKSGEQKSGEQKSGEQKSGEQKSGEQKSGEQKSGEQKSGEQKSGEQKSGEQKSGEQKSGEQKSGEQKSGEQKSGEGAGGQEGEASKGSEAGEPGQMDSGKNSTAQTGGGGAGGSGTETPSSVSEPSSGESPQLTPEEANLANKKKAVDLALKKLQDQIERGETPQELMEQLGYTEKDLSSFMQRLEERLSDPGINKEAETEAARRQFDSLLKGLDYKSTGERRDGGDHERQAAEGFGGANRPVIPEYREEDEAFKRKLSRQGTKK